MNAALAAFVQDLRDTAPEECGHGPTLRKCCNVVDDAHSPIDPQKVHHLAAFGEGFIAQRIRKHFASEDSRSKLPSAVQNELCAQVRGELDALLSGGRLAGRALSPALRRGLQQTREGLEAFLSLDDLRDVALLRGCPAQLAGHLASQLRPGQKRAGGGAGLCSEPLPGKRAKTAEAELPACKAPASEEPDCEAGQADVTSTSPDRFEEASSTPGCRKTSSADGHAEPHRKRCKQRESKAQEDAGKAGVPVRSPSDTGKTGGRAGATPTDCKAETADSPPKLVRPSRPFTGEWAIMVALHLMGKPLSRADLVEAIAVHQLCSKRLAAQHQPPAEAEEVGGDERSACARLINRGWVSSTGPQQYALTEVGKAEAARCTLQRAALTSKESTTTAAEDTAPLRKSVDNSTEASDEGNMDSASVAKNAGEECDRKAGCEVSGRGARGGKARGGSRGRGNHRGGGRAAGRGRGAGRGGDAGEGEEDGAEADPPTAGGARAAADDGAAGAAAGAEAGGAAAGRGGAKGKASVLVDVREQPVIRAALGRLLASSAELQIPGIDYAFGWQRGEEWSLADVLLERKTVYDYQGTLASSHGVHQARIQASLQTAGFRVAVLLEGSGELSRHPQQDELLTSIYAGSADVLTTASVNDTAELLTGFAEAARERPGWGLARIKALLKPLYATDPSCLCTAALVASGISRQVAERLTRGHGELHKLLALLPGPGGDAEAVVADVAKSSGLTLYQAGKALRALGLERAPLLRKRGPRSSQAAKEQAQGGGSGRRWRAGALGRARLELCVKVGTGTHREFARCVRKLLPQAEKVESMAPNTVQLNLGKSGPSYTFAVGEGDCLEKGMHWLLLPSAGDWRQVTRARARAYAEHAVVSSLCASPSQAARHVAACAAGLAQANAVALGSEAARARAAAGPRAASGLAGALGLARTAQGALPAAVAENLARRSRCAGLYQLVLKLRQAGGKWLQALSVKDLGPERAAAVKTFLLGN